MREAEPFSPIKDCYVAYLLSLGFNLRESSAIMDALMYAERIGVTTHGLNRLHSGFVERLLTQGTVEQNREPILRDQSGGYFLFDSNRSIGYYAAMVILRRVLGSEPNEDLLFVNIANLYPTNCLAQYAELLCEGGYVCYITSKSPDIVSPPVDKEKTILRLSRAVGTNAFAWGFPSPDGHPIIFDTTMAAATNGMTLQPKDIFEQSFSPDSYLTELFGVPQSPDDLFDVDGRFSGVILPFGGEKNYKGFGCLLPAEVFNLLQSDNATNTSTTVIGIKVKDRRTYDRKIKDLKNRYYRSLLYSDGSGPRLPFDRASNTRASLSDDTILAKYSAEAKALQLTTRDTFLSNIFLPTKLPNAFSLNDQRTPASEVDCDRPNQTVQTEDYKNELILRVIYAAIDRLGLRETAQTLVRYAHERDDSLPFFATWGAETYELPRLPDHYALMRHAGRLMQFEPADRVLDIGCGNGSLLRHIGTCERVDCLDLSSEMLRQIHTGEPDYPFEVRLLNHDFLDFEPTIQYTKVVSIMGLHHIPDASKDCAIRKCHDILAMGGSLFVGETFVDTTLLDVHSNLENIANVYLRKIVNAYSEGCFRHALKELQILRRILFADGEYMLPLWRWRSLLSKNKFHVSEWRVTNPFICYGYLYAKKTST